MSYRAIDFAMQVNVDTSAERLVLLCLAWHMNDQTGRCDPSVEGIKVRTLIGIHQVKSALRTLEEKGLIERTEVRGKRTQYRIPIDTRSQSIPRTDQYPVSISTPYQSVPTPGTDKYPLPVLISTPNKEENREENKEVQQKAKTRKPRTPRVTFPSSIPDGWMQSAREQRPDLSEIAILNVYKKLRAYIGKSNSTKTITQWRAMFISWTLREFASTSYGYQRREMTQQERIDAGGWDDPFGLLGDQH